jgi:hypothetical protein
MYSINHYWNGKKMKLGEITSTAPSIQKCQSLHCINHLQATKRDVIATRDGFCSWCWSAIATDEPTATITLTQSELNLLWLSLLSAGHGQLPTPDREGRRVELTDEAQKRARDFADLIYSTLNNLRR